MIGELNDTVYAPATPLEPPWSATGQLDSTEASSAIHTRIYYYLSQRFFIYVEKRCTNGARAAGAWER